MTVQEEFWRGEFGTSYTARNRLQWNLRVPFWDDIISWVKPSNVLEVGCNAGFNLRAIRSVEPSVEIKGIDVNATALAEASGAGFDVEEMSLLDVGAKWPDEFDLVFSCGVLIHVAPEHLNAAMDSIISASRQYVLCVEYEAAKEEAIPYRGHADRLWRRPFSELYERKGLILIDKGDAGSGFDRCAFALLRKP